MLNKLSTSALFANSLITACLTPLKAVTAPIPPPIKDPWARASRPPSK